MEDDLSFVSEVGKRQVAGQSPSSQEGMRSTLFSADTWTWDPPAPIEEVEEIIDDLREEIDEEKHLQEESLSDSY